MIEHAWLLPVSCERSRHPGMEGSEPEPRWFHEPDDRILVAYHQPPAPSCVVSQAHLVLVGMTRVCSAHRLEHPGSCLPVFDWLSRVFGQDSTLHIAYEERWEWTKIAQLDEHEPCKAGRRVETQEACRNS